MLNNLHVKNLALIDEVEVEFGKGLNILTGETGAGKSIIIGSLGLALGDRAETDIIRTGAEYALVELSLSTDKSEVWDKLTDMGIDRDGDELLIQRRIYPGRSVCRVNGETITLKELAQVSELLIDICGQRDSLKLLKNNALRAMLDESGGSKLKELLDELKGVYAKYRETLAKLNETDDDEILRKRKADLAQFELNEIDAANLHIGEDEQVESDYRRMQHSSKISEGLNVVSKLCGNEGAGASGQLSRALREIKAILEYDESLCLIESMLADAEAITADLNREIWNYIDNSEFDEEAFSFATERLNTINRLKDKYGRTIEDILQYRQDKEAEIERLNDYEAYMDSLNKDVCKLKERMDDLCGQIHDIRYNAAGAMSDKLMEALADMNFETAKLKVVVEKQDEAYSANGYDYIDFLISLNPGEELKPLSSVASGGELSRIMLALKCVIASRDNIDTMVFDEIDTGISGVTAWKVAGKMSELSNEHQVICITHQAQIAAFADSHFLIEKSVKDEHTSTDIRALNREEMVAELARMMGADEPTKAAIDAALDLKNRACGI